MRISEQTIRFTLKTGSFFTILFVVLMINTQAQQNEKKGKTVVFQGNIFRLTAPKTDTLIVVDPVSGNEQYHYIKLPDKPIKMNGNKIYTTAEVDTKPQFTDKSKSFNDYILEPIHKSFNKLPDGNYNLKITNIVIGAKGGLVYYNMDSLDNDLKTLPSDYKIWITEKIKKMLDKFPEMTPAWLNDEHVPCLFYEWWDKRIIVKDHIAKFDE